LLAKFMLAIAVTSSLFGAQPAHAGNPYSTPFASCLMQNAHSGPDDGTRVIRLLYGGGACNDVWVNWMHECAASGADDQSCAVISSAQAQRAFDGR
jgi:hypothetical protein